jgi:WD40-like Beta Propeller Repeat
MTVDRFEGQLPDILVELALPRTPDYIDDILSQTARTRQRPGWTFPERWLPMDLAVNVPAGGRRVPWRALGVTMLIAVLLALAIAAVGSRQHRVPAPFGPAANGSLVYDRDGDIYVSDRDVSHERLLIGGETTDSAPTWSRDGSRIYFARQLADGIAVMTADLNGQGVRQVSPRLLIGHESHDLSPTSAELAVIDKVSGQRTLRVLSLAGDGGVRALDLGTLEPTKFVAWRPGASNEIIFGGHPGGEQTDLGLYAIRSDGTGLRQLVLQHNEAIEGAPNPTQYSFQGLSMTADGSRAAYWNWETTVQPGHSCFIHLLDLTTGVDRRMMFDPSAECELGPLFTPNGKTIVAERGNLESTSQLFVAPVGVPGPGVPVGPTYNYRSRLGFALSPDGSKVIWVPTPTLGPNAGGRLITLATGAVENSDVQFLDVPSWQRLALPDQPRSERPPPAGGALIRLATDAVGIH